MLVERTVLGVMFWSIACIFSFLTSIILFIFVNEPRSVIIYGYSHKVAASVLGLVNSGLYAISAVKSYKLCKSSWSYQ
ncbi:hypothetical protein X975_23700, partial [Stegodyphus mimosarum]